MVRKIFAKGDGGSFDSELLKKILILAFGLSPSWGPQTVKWVIGIMFMCALTGYPLLFCHI